MSNSGDYVSHYRAFITVRIHTLYTYIPTYQYGNVISRIHHSPDVKKKVLLATVFFFYEIFDLLDGLFLKSYTNQNF